MSVDCGCHYHNLTGPPAREFVLRAVREEMDRTAEPGAVGPAAVTDDYVADVVRSLNRLLAVPLFPDE